MESEVIEFIELIKEIAPEVWRVVMKQVYIEVAARMCWALLFLGFSFASFRLRNAFKVTRDHEWIPWCGVLFFGFITFALVLSSAMWLSNPEFYAIRWLFEQATP